jgi:hypothetical protein
LGDERLPVDLHWSLFRPDSLKINFWEFTREVKVANLHVRTLSVEATIVHLAYAIANSGILGFRFLNLCDFVRLTSSSNISYEVKILGEIVDKIGADRYMKVSLSVANRLFNFNVPDALNQIFKSDFLSECLLYPATYLPALFEPTNKRTLFQKITIQSLWDLALFRFPWASIEELASILIRFLNNRNP